jgi:hypothetical protein
MDFRQKIEMLDELRGYLSEQAGEEMKGMPMDGEDDEDDFPPSSDEAPSLAIAIEAPKDGPPKPPPPGGGDSDIDALISKGMASSDPTVKAMAEALSKAKAKTHGGV